MMVIRSIPLILSALLLAAHFLRGGNWALTGVCALSPFLLLYRKKWVLTLVQVATCVGSGVWIYTAMRLVEQRLEGGAPWVRMALIMGGVALFTLWAAVLMNSERVKEKFAEQEER